jgi:hypothetical protein
MLGERTRRSSGFVEVAGPEARQLDKLAWSRRCAMLMESACPWKLEHVCLTFLERSRCLDNITESLDHQSDRLCALPFVQTATGKKKVCCHDCCSGLIAIGSSVQSPAGLALESILKSHGVCPLNRTMQWYEIDRSNADLPREASRKCLGLAYDGVASECLFGHNFAALGVDTSQARRCTSREIGM